jgi:hypothetical protein
VLIGMLRIDRKIISVPIDANASPISSSAAPIAALPLRSFSLCHRSPINAKHPDQHEVFLIVRSTPSAPACRQAGAVRTQV